MVGGHEAARVAELTGRVALITGAGRGIGRAISLELSGAGARVVLLARSVHELRETADRVRARGGTALVLPADVADPAQLATAERRMADEFGVVDVLINNAGVAWPVAASLEVDPTEWAAAININLIAAARLSFALLPAMLEQRWGRIVNVSSGIAGRPEAMPRANAYATSKAALEVHSVNLAVELTGTGVTVNAFRPGMVDSGMQAWIRGQTPEKVGQALHEQFLHVQRAGRLATPEHAAHALMSHLASAETGQIWDAAAR